jgi:hypothetical protein
MQTALPEIQREYLSIFAPSTRGERKANFEDYWTFDLEHSGEILEEEQNLTKKKQRLAEFKENAVRSKVPLPDPEVFYRNYVHLVDDPQTFDRKTLLLTCIYKFARHEWVGITAAWDYLPVLAKCKSLTDKISRYHIAEEFCHVRLFHEMFETCQLDRVEWVPLGKWMGRVYKLFPYVPEVFMSAPAFVTELMGITFYMHVDAMLDEVFHDDPDVAQRIRALLHEIMVDELAHIGQRRNFMGPISNWLARKIITPLFKAFFADIPESKLLLDVDKMIQEAKVFDYSKVSAELMARTWVPSYCRSTTPTPAIAAAP